MLPNGHAIEDQMNMNRINKTLDIKSLSESYFGNLTRTGYCSCHLTELIINILVMLPKM